MSRGLQIVFDAADPTTLGAFWLAVLERRGYRYPDPPGGFADWPAFLKAQGVPEDQWDSAYAIESTEAGLPRIFFQRVPEPKTAKNRVHLDLLTGGGPGVPIDEQRQRAVTEVERLVGLGATRGEEYTEMGVHWVTMHDPEGNEFCV